MWRLGGLDSACLTAGMARLNVQSVLKVLFLNYIFRRKILLFRPSRRQVGYVNAKKKLRLQDYFESGSEAPDSVYVIAEIGSNYGARLDIAMAYIEACARAGADAVKFQSWNTSMLQNAIDSETGSRCQSIPILQQYELPDEWHEQLKMHCEVHGVDFLSTPFDVQKAQLVKRVGSPAIKIASGDLTYTQLLQEVGTYGMPVLLSTGMADLDEIRSALDALGSAREYTILLHCVGAYPPALEDANLRAIRTLADTFDLPVGFSDHYPGYATAVAAVALGARVIEKHVTFSRQAGHPDSPFALEMDEFAEMVAQIRLLETALGDGDKRCRTSEAGGRIGGRRSLYWVADLVPGTVVEPDHVTPLRPALGELAPADLEHVIGRRVSKAIQAGTPASWSDLTDE